MFQLPKFSPLVRVYAAFFLYALALGSFFPRVGDLQLAMGIGEGTLGAALIGTGIGTFVALTFAVPMLKKVSHRDTLLFGTAALSLIMALASFATGPVVMFAILFCAGLTIGGMEVVSNLEADRLEHQLGRGIMSRCHAFWSFGFFSAGFVGAIAKQLGISPQLHLMGMVPIVIVASIMFLFNMQPAPPRSLTAKQQGPHVALPTLGLMGLVFFTISALLLEGAGTDWSVIFMRESFTVAPFVNGAAFAVGALAQATMRYFADGFITRYGALFMARFFILVLGLGTLVVVFAPSAAFALVGFACIGIGTSAIFPMAMSAAAQRTDRSPAQNVAALSQFAFVAFLVGPPILGFVAEHLGVRYAFAVCLPFVAISWVTRKNLTPHHSKSENAHG